MFLYVSLRCKFYKWNKKIEKSARIRLIRIIHVLPPDRTHKQAQAQPFQIPASRMGQAFRTDRR